LAVARAEEATRRVEKRKAEAEAKEATAAAKRARIRQEECDEAIRQIHLLRDEMETVGERAEELLAKLVSMADCDTSVVEMAWMERLVREAMAAEQRLLQVIEANEVDWQVDQHNEFMDGEDAEEEEDEAEELGSDDDDDEDDDEDVAGVKLGRFGQLEVVADEDVEREEGADAFDEDEYKRAMAALRKGRMAPGDLRGMEYEAKA